VSGCRAPTKGGRTLWLGVPTGVFAVAVSPLRSTPACASEARRWSPRCRRPRERESPQGVSIGRWGRTTGRGASGVAAAGRVCSAPMIPVV